MKPRPFPLLVLLGIAIGGVVAWLGARHAHETTNELLSLAENQTRLTNALQGANARLARARKTTGDLHSRIQTLSATPIAPKTDASAAPDPSRIIDDSPTLQNLQFAARRAQFAITYSPFYRQLGLSPAQIGQFERNLLRREERQADLAATATSHGSPSNTDPAFQKLYGQVWSDYQAAQLALLGDTGAQQLRDYDRLANVRETVSGMAGAAAMAGTPLDTQQAEQLTQTLAKASHTYPNSTTPDTGAIDWRLVHEQAKAFLSPSQLTFIETTEARGPRGSGGRFLPVLNATIDDAARADAPSPSSVAGP